MGRSCWVWGLMGIVGWSAGIDGLAERPAPSPYKVMARDVTGDGVEELVLAFHDAGVIATESVEAGGTAFRLLALSPVCDQMGRDDPSYQSGVYNIDLGDFDKDGLVDLLAGCHGNFAVLARNAGGGRFLPVLKLPTESSAKGVHFADLDRDGLLDLLYTGRGIADKLRSGGKLHVRRGLAGGRFGEELVFDAGNSAYYVTTADLNEDGYLDVLVPNERDTTVTYWISPGRRALQQPQGWSRKTLQTSGQRINDVRAADFNGDGHLDLITANWVSSTISFFPGRGDGSFGDEKTWDGGLNCVFFRVADFDQDGDADFAVTHWQSDFVSVFSNNGQAEFERRDYEAGAGNYGVDSFDADRDGRPDLVVANFQDESLSLLRGEGNGVFGKARRLRRFVARDAQGHWQWLGSPAGASPPASGRGSETGGAGAAASAN